METSPFCYNGSFSFDRTLGIDMLHRFDAKGSQPPAALTFPYHHGTHPWVREAALRVMQHLDETAQLQPGRLVALLIVKDKEGKLGYWAGCDEFDADDDYFVKSFWQQLPAEAIATLKFDDLGAALEARATAENEYLTFKQAAKERKTARHAKRTTKLTDEQRRALTLESQRDSGELERLKTRLTQAIVREEKTREKINRDTEAALFNDWKRRLETVTLTNTIGETVTLFDLLKPCVTNEVWLKSLLRTSLPALLAKAFAEKASPIAYGTFWWGPVPSHDARQRGVFYAFSKERHEAFLSFQLKGLAIEANPFALEHFAHWQPEILYEDESIVAVNKPAGLLSVPGKHGLVNVYETIQKRYPEATGPMLLHRLDMATSGVLVFAKDKTSHQKLQADFMRGKVVKRYVALLEKAPAKPQGAIDLPLCLNPLERPRQMVNAAYGRAALTLYEVLGTQDNLTRVAFYPQTGRTHQLRLHAAHAEGLAAPIVGDELYGHPAERLFLHAESLAFKHPATGKVITIEASVPF